MFRLLPLFLLLVSLAPVPVSGQSTSQKKPAKPVPQKTEEADAAEAQQRTIAISLVTALADEAKTFKDLTRRARVQARAADVLWDTEPEKSRELFKRAWEAAEVVDAEAARKRAAEIKKMEDDGGPVVIRGGNDLRAEVLRLVAKRDRQFGEELLKVLDEATQKERDEAATQQRLNNQPNLAVSKRLQLARRLLDDDQIERALEFATPAMDRVGVDSIFFLSALREKNAELADAAFSMMLARVVRDPLSDANTVSGLSSYVLTPFLYVTFERDGGANQNQQRGPTPPPNVSTALRSSFLNVGYQILMQPLSSPDQDRTTSGQTGKYMIIKRLLPVYEQSAADLAAGLRTQMTALASYVPREMAEGENRAVTKGIGPEQDESDPIQRMQQRLDRARTADDRDAIYADYAVALTGAGDPRAKDLVDKIENTELRKSVKAYTDFELLDQAIQRKDVTEVSRLTKNGELTGIQKVWGLIKAAKLVTASERSRALDFLDSAVIEARRISNSDPDRARALTAAAAGFNELDQVRTWELLSEVVKAANGAELFTGEDSSISSRLQTRQMVVMNNASAVEFDLLNVFRQLARADLMRAIQMAKTFSGEAPRAVATLAIARSILEKTRSTFAGASN